MATRIYCDHCGNTCRNPNVFYYGPAPLLSPSYQNVQAVYVQGGLLGGGGGFNMPNPPTPPALQNKTSVVIESIDLCDRCVPIWMERVGKLTKHDV